MHLCVNEDDYNTFAHSLHFLCQITDIHSNHQVLRAIRFSSRLHFSLDEDLVSAASSEPVASALLHKVSRERVYKELDGMMNTSTSRPYVAFALMYRWDAVSVS